MQATGMRIFSIGSELKLKPPNNPLDHMFVSVANTFISILCPGIVIAIDNSTSTPVA